MHFCVSEALNIQHKPQNKISKHTQAHSILELTCIYGYTSQNAFMSIM